MSAGVSYAGMAFNFEIMKNLFCLCILLLIGSMQMSRASDKIEKQPLKVLYVGGSADIQVLNETISDSTALRKSIADRTAAFGEMLRQYFQTVKVVAAEDWTPEMSRAYDVTVMDGRPKAIKPAWQEKDASGKVIAYHSAVYLPESFDRPMVTIAEVGNTVGRGIGLKSDWYCLCLDADAHHWRAEHPIFKGPFPVKMTVRMCPTPSDAFHYAYFMDEPVPDSVLMWKVQNKGYQTHEGFRVGMVARPWGFEDSPDAEYISSGVCAKTLDAVAIGRHGNFLHWGFAASPADMTEEAKTVFANAIVYISRFAGQKPFVRKYNDRIATREYVKEQLYLSTREAWQERVKSDEEFAAEGLKLKKVVQEKQRRGEKLNRREEMFLNYEPQPPMSYADMLKRYQGELFDLFGEDEAAYARYYRENIEYFYGGEGMYVLSIDEDVKSLGIPYNDKRLLDTAIRLLEKGKETEKANRILHRYTLCRFEAPQEWRTWYEKNKERLFFTESGGWLFMVNTREPDPANDYSARYAQPVQETSSRPAATDDRNPVQMVAGLEKAANGNREIVVRLKIHPGYHIYAYVAESDPFVTTQVELQLPEGWTIVGKPKLPSAKSYNKQGTTVYEDEAIFRYEISGSGQGEAKCTVSYQCCDAHICFPPIEKELKVMLK